MKSSKKLVFSVLFAGLMVGFPTSFASAATSRYFVNSTKSFWKNALGVRQSFSNGFTTNLSDFQVKLNKLVGLSLTLVKTYQILDLDPSQSPSPTVSPTPTVTAVTEEEEVVEESKIQTEPTEQIPWGVKAVYGDRINITVSGGKDIKVAVLDTGADIEHPDLKDSIEQCKDFTNFKYPVQDNKCEDGNGHGTHVAGVIAANGGPDAKGIYGVAPETKLFIYKVCDDQGACYSDDIAAAIRMAVDQGANIINMGFGGDSGSSLIYDAVNYAVSKNVMLVAPAGNDGPDNEILDYPASLDSVIAVGALNQLLEVADWSSRGTNSSSKAYVVEKGDIELVAPGENIESTGTANDYVILSGTSMAAPFVTGLAAKYWRFDDKNPASATRDYLHILAVDISPKGDDDMSGFGMPRVLVPEVKVEK